jgi:copper resistance protein B
MKHLSLVLAAFAALLPMAPADAQMVMGGPSAAAPFGAPVDDEHVFYHLAFDQLEGRLGRDESFRWEGEGWAGTDTNRILLKSEGTLTRGVMEEGDQEILYARPISTYFNLQGGLRYDLDSAPGRGWAALGFEGLAPLFFHVSATAYAGDGGRLAGKLEGSYDLLLTQTLILQPQMELNIYSRDDRARQLGAGLSDLDAGLRLRYEITRKLAPYVGIAYQNSFGASADFAQASGAYTADLRFTAGIRAWL